MTAKLNDKTDFQHSRIEDIVINIPNYVRQDHEKPCEYFVGREGELEKLENLLSTGGYGGAYLIVGARGMGKTTLINRVIKSLNDKNLNKKEFEKIEISLSNENFEEIDVFRIIGKKLLNKYLDEGHPFTSWKETLFRILPLLIILTIGVFGFINSFCLNELFDKSQEPFWVWVGIIAYTLGFLIVLGILAEWLFDKKKFLNRKRAKRLLKRMDAEVTRESNFSGSLGLTYKVPNGNIGLGSSTSEKYPIADIRFIEHELIEFLKTINKQNKKRFQVKRRKRKQYVFVFDELDKIEPTTLSETLEQQLTEEIEDIPSRKKQQAVFDILGNFKYFLKNAPAKFVFIAGREMTDASMADVSKRNFYLRSIFDRIIHVPSLLKEGKQNIDLRITNQIEEYFLKILAKSNKVPPGHLRSDADFVESLKWLLRKIDWKKYGLPDEEIIGPRLQKSISFLRDFILYLTYRSHGAPKLLVQYFERFIHIKNGRYQLKFSYDQQLVISFHAAMYRPFIQEKYNVNVGNSDKLLTTLPFLYDHILKYHNFAFSWRSLELLPEVIDVNKSPNLRYHIENLVDYFKSNYVSEISNGLFEYKFNKAMASEIQWIGNISKTSRAAFNFTLDESLPLKRTYKKRIKRLEKLHFTADTSLPTQEYIHSLGFYYTILGDLHFYDKEYDLAIENYNQAVQPLRKKDINTEEPDQRIHPHEFIIYVRGILKLTLTYERMKDYDLILTYQERINQNIYHFFHFTFYKWRHFQTKGREDRERDIIESEIFQLNNQWLFVDGLLNVLYITEKSFPQGVTQSDVDFCKNRFIELVDSSFIIPQIKEKWFFASLKAHFFNHLGDLLFFKNGILSGHRLHPRSGEEDISKVYFDRMVEAGWIPNEELQKYTNYPISGYEYYFLGLWGLMEDFGYLRNLRNELTNHHNSSEERSRNEVRILTIYTDYIELERRLFGHNHQSKHFYLIAGYLADFGNSLLIFSNDSTINQNVLYRALSDLDSNDTSMKRKFVKYLREQEDDRYLFESSPTLKFFLFTYLSAQYYKKINKQTEYAYALMKILYVIKYNLSTGNDSQISLFNLNNIYRSLFVPAYRSLSKITDLNNTNLSEAELKLILKREKENKTSPRQRELVIVFCEILFNLKKGKIEKELVKILLEGHWITPDNHISNSWIRTLELRLKVRINEKLLRSQTFDNYVKSNILADSLWCLRKVRTNLEVLGVSYVANYYFRAEAHFDMANILAENKPLINGIGRKLLMSIDEKGYGLSLNEERVDSLLSSTHNYRRALEDYLSTVQLHTQGPSYYDTIRGMYYLEGDFDDQTTHFCASLDRYRINTGVIEERITYCRLKLNDEGHW